MPDSDHIHDENCDHDHEDGEIEITINPRDEDLLEIGVSPEEFEAALMKTLDAYDKAIEVTDPDSISPLEDAEITLAGKVYHLHEVADIEISGDLDALGEEEDDDDDEFEDDEDDDEDEDAEHSAEK